MLEFLPKIIEHTTLSEYLADSGPCRFRTLTKIPDAILWLPFGIVQDSSGKILRSTIATAVHRPTEAYPEKIWNRSVLDRFENGDHQSYPLASSHAVLGFNPDYNNLWHWHTQSLPSVNEAVETLGRDINLLFPKLRAWQLRALEVIGFGEKAITLGMAERKLKLKALHIADGNCWQDFRRVDISQKTLELIKVIRDRVAGAGPTRSANRRIYVDRSDLERRRILNVEHLRSFLRDHNFEIFDPGTHSYDEQIKTFAEASIVVGSHGAGMTNISFCPQHARVLELTSSECQRDLFKILADRQGLIYQKLVFPTVWASERKDPTYDADMIVEIDSLQQVLHDWFQQSGLK